MLNMIELKNVSFSYDDTNFVLKDIDLNVNIDDFLVIIGPNGGGKSTLLKLMLGLLEPQSGSIKVFDKSPKSISNAIGYVPQSFIHNQNFPITVIEVVLMGLIDKKMFGFYTKDQKQQALNALKMVDMQEYANSRIDKLSGGQRQRVYIARALCTKSKILMLDEPTASVDTKTQAEIYSLLKHINAQGVAIVLISHDANIALSFATKVAYVSKNLHLHNITPDLNKQEFIAHLAKNHNHFCDVELALKECGCD
nr:metal ABC transporter ATP-binding protein [Campylobacter pinnipediorum]